MRAYCFASGQIEFGQSVPDGALPIARGRDKALKDFIGGVARHGYSTRVVKGRITKIPGTETLLVPGIPEAPDQGVALEALQKFCKWIRGHAPTGVTVIVGGA